MYSLKSRVLLLSIIALLSCKNEKKEFPVYNADPGIDRLAGLDVKLGRPQPGDWLDAHHEPGQTFKDYVKSKPVTPSEKRSKIYLQPIGNFSQSESELIAYTADYLNIFFNLETVILPVLSDTIVPSSARRTIHSGEQLKTGFIMDYLQKHIPEDGIVIMAITPVDLYPSASYNYVFGQARTKNRVGVSSFNRFIDVPLDSVNYNLCLSRLIKTSSHEIGHMFSCLHCTHAICLMNGSNSLWESDGRLNRLCSDCLRKLQWNTRFEVKPRLEKLIAYFERHNLKDDYKASLKDLSIYDSQ